MQKPASPTNIRALTAIRIIRYRARRTPNSISATKHLPPRAKTSGLSAGSRRTVTTTWIRLQGRPWPRSGASTKHLPGRRLTPPKSKQPSHRARPTNREAPLKIWGGIECTIARIGDRFRDQLCDTGHDRRADDIDAIAALGIRTLRYPVLWEQVAPVSATSPRWDWADARLERLRAHAIRLIVGLVHHGSGPRYTNLLDPAFPRLLADYAAAVARRYPWIEMFTPVNEPLTTARFSCLYGHWYPHARDQGAFLRALVHECYGIKLAMERIREVQPAARLVQ